MASGGMCAVMKSDLEGKAMRNSPVSMAIYRAHIRMYRYLNDSCILTDLLLPDLTRRAKERAASFSLEKKPYPVPKRDRIVMSKRRDSDIAALYRAYYKRGIFETNIVSMVSRMEAFIQECMAIAIIANPEKLGIISEKTGIPIQLFLSHQSRDELIMRYVTMRCEALMFSKPKDYISKACNVLSIQLDDDLIDTYIEIKASRDIIIHNRGTINALYVEKAGVKARGDIGDALIINKAYFVSVLIALKTLSEVIQRETELQYG